MAASTPPTWTAWSQAEHPSNLTALCVFEYLPDGSFDKTREHVTMGISSTYCTRMGGDRCDAEGCSEAMNLQGRSCCFILVLEY